MAGGVCSTDKSKQTSTSIASPAATIIFVPPFRYRSAYHLQLMGLLVTARPQPGETPRTSPEAHRFASNPDRRRPLLPHASRAAPWPPHGLWHGSRSGPAAADRSPPADRPARGPDRPVDVGPAHGERSTTPTPTVRPCRREMPR